MQRNKCRSIGFNDGVAPIENNIAAPRDNVNERCNRQRRSFTFTGDDG